MKENTRMRGYNGWSYTPYRPAAEADRSEVPYICRLAPYERTCEVEWLGQGDTFSVYYRERGSFDWEEKIVKAKEAVLEDLDSETEYEIRVCDSRHCESRVRLFRTSLVEGRIVNYLHPEDAQYDFSGRYLCSPSLVRLPSGVLLASMDVYGARMPQNLTLLFRSDDDGETWRYVTDLFPCFWGKLFWHQGKLYMLASSNEYGDILIGCSENEGKTWGTPVVIRRGSCNTEEMGNHKAPVPILRSHGRLWTGVEYGTWRKKSFYDSLLSIDENADPMIAENWTLTDYIRADRGWVHANADAAGAIEGNALEAPDGSVVDFLRYGENKALILKADPDDPEKRMEFVCFAEFPMAHTKFEIQRTEEGVYLAVGNPLPGRTVLSLYQSKDLDKWDKVCDVINHREYGIKEVGFQYPVFLIEGDELLILSRTAWNRAHSFHDSNYTTFHHVKLSGEMQGLQ